MPVTPLRAADKQIDIDTAVERLAAIKAFATLLSFGYAGESLAEANPQIVAAAFNGFALLAADATKALHGPA